jgi:hypothetical protein
MSDELIDSVEEYLLTGGAADDDKPITYGKSMSFGEMRAMYGDEWADDFLRQFSEIHKGIHGAQET